MSTGQDRNSQLLLYVILALLVLNLCATGWLAFRSAPASIRASTAAALPESLDAEERMRLFESFRDAYNAEDLQAAFEVFHPIARLRMSEDQTKQILSDLRTTFGNIEEAVYSNFSYRGYSGGFHTYDLYFVVQYSGGKSGGTSGTVTMTVFDSGDEIGVSGLNLK